jgi:hypothetical protein
MRTELLRFNGAVERDPANTNPRGNNQDGASVYVIKRSLTRRE